MYVSSANLLLVPKQRNEGCVYQGGEGFYLVKRAEVNGWGEEFGAGVGYYSICLLTSSYSSEVRSCFFFFFLHRSFQTKTFQNPLVCRRVFNGNDLSASSCICFLPFWYDSFLNSSSELLESHPQASRFHRLSEE